MNTNRIDFSQLTAEKLSQLGEHAVHQLALQACGTLSAYRLLLRRCLLAIQRADHYLAFGCSGTIHYATVILGMKAKEARLLRRVAHRLEGLPVLSVAAQQGKIEWSKLREVVTVAVAETEEFWLRACDTITYADIERLAEIEEILGEPKRGDYRKYNRFFKYFVKLVPCPELVRRAAASNFREWLLENASP